MTSDRDGLRALIAAFATAGACVGLTYVVPALATLRPWVPGEPLPVVAALVPQGAPRVVEDGVNGLTAAPAVAEPPLADSSSVAGSDAASVAGSAVPGMPTAADASVADATSPADPTAADPTAADPTAAADPSVTTAAATTPPGVPLPDAAGMPARPPGVATALVDPDHRGMDVFYRALHRAAGGDGLARAAHYGDSTIAADGISGQVRARLQARFGNGGPGYLSAGMDPRWNIRKDVSNSRSGEWETVSLLLGGGNGRYSYGGIVSTAAADAALTLYAPKGPDGARVPMHRFELWFQGGPERGGWWAALDGASAGGGSAAAASTVDLWHAVDVPQGYTKASIGATGGPVPFYGVVMETKGPGVVWDALGVVGVGSRSFTQHGKRHLAGQIARRDPDLLVVMLGGNELGLPALEKGDGSAYVPWFTDTLRRLRAGAPDASCLIITPVDQGTREGGTARTKPTLARLVEGQRKAAENEGCAFWNAWAAMGGADSIVRWSRMKPPLAWTDLNHLSKAGQDIVGNLLADAIEHGYDRWLAAGGPARPAPATAAASDAELPANAPAGASTGVAPVASPPPTAPSGTPPAPTSASPAPTSASPAPASASPAAPSPAPSPSPEAPAAPEAP